MTENEKNLFREWEIILKNFSDYAQVGKVNGIKFEIRPKERGHNIPHLHVSTSSSRMSVAIESGEVLALTGKISSSQKKMATEWILKNHDLLVSKWNELSDGILISIE